MFARLVVVIAILAGQASAQPASVIGKPLPSADLPVGTVSVRVIDGSSSAPHAGIAVWLSVDGVAKTATTDASGRASFAGLKVGAKVIAAITVGKTSVKSEPFVVTDDGGVRVMLTTVPLGSPQIPKARDISGIPRPDEKTPVGTLDVRLTYDDLADPHPPAKVAVALVSYREDGAVAVATQASDAKGVARFTGLDHTGLVAYYALATLSRGGRADRLASSPIVLGDTEGSRVILSAEARTAKAPPIDDLAPKAATAKRKLHVRIDGLTEPGTPVQIIDAASGKGIATTTAEKEVTLDVPAGDRVLYVEAVARGQHYRSRPFQTVADRGAEITVFVFPRVLVEYGMLAEASGASIVTWAQLSVQNNSWIPHKAIEIPLPKGFARPEIGQDDRAQATVTAAGVALSRPLVPGEQRVRVRFDLAAAADGKVHWGLDLPFGAYQSEFHIAKDPGVAITGAKLPVTTTTSDGEDYLAISEISILPGQSMAMEIELPKLSAGQAAVARACQPLDPDRKTALRGKPVPDFTAPKLDGTKLRLSSLRGKVILVNFMATWDMLTKDEQPTFAPLAAALGKDLAIVLVASDADPAEVAAKVGAKPPFQVVLDAPVGTANIGPITTSWGVHLIPESFVVDRHGVVRLYLSNARDWSTPAARACLEALARD
jgi:peroxiredoxin